MRAILESGTVRAARRAAKDASSHKGGTVMKTFFRAAAVALALAAIAGVLFKRRARELGL
ncbi:MAG TPA: hypothetical protein VKW09_03355 [bacterium]|nr:hypothetical protein [bacterium]